MPSSNRGGSIDTRPRGRESEREEQGEKAARRAKRKRQRSQSVSQSVRSACTRETWREMACVPALASVNAARECAFSPADVNWNYTCVVTREMPALERRPDRTGHDVRAPYRAIHLDRQGRVVLSLERSSSSEDPLGTDAVPPDAVQMRTCRSFVSDFNRDADDSNGSTTADSFNAFHAWISALCAEYSRIFHCNKFPRMSARGKLISAPVFRKNSKTRNVHFRRSWFEEASNDSFDLR
ncbi:hypothetical protein K0M31_004417 [Melipona bicolor]|uniref:Uncharacterized protein n=1 Tax=Melipona bicolor TaxID=60889 RepID=A0AA40FWQ7_9HYME|nr:hypothetical protein K0M31_004417 [Melipona bicolor]